MGEFVHIGNVRGMRKALEVCERMMKTAPEPKRLNSGDGLPRCVDGSMCGGTGFVELRSNVVKICECRAAAISLAKKREQEQVKPHRDVVDFLLSDDE